MFWIMLSAGTVATLLGTWLFAKASAKVRSINRKLPFYAGRSRQKYLDKSSRNQFTGPAVVAQDTLFETARGYSAAHKKIASESRNWELLIFIAILLLILGVGLLCVSNYLYWLDLTGLVIACIVGVSSVVWIRRIWRKEFVNRDATLMTEYYRDLS